MPIFFSEIDLPVIGVVMFKLFSSSTDLSYFSQFNECSHFWRKINVYYHVLTIVPCLYWICLATVAVWWKWWFF